MRYMRFEWTKTEQHSALVRVPDDFDPMSGELGDELAAIETDHTFDGCQRDEIGWTDVDESTPGLLATARMNAEDFGFE